VTASTRTAAASATTTTTTTTTTKHGFKGRNVDKIILQDENEKWP
jgi:hypothetical protein